MFNFNSIVESTSQLAVFTFDRNNLTVDFYVNAAGTTTGALATRDIFSSD